MSAIKECWDLAMPNTYAAMALWPIYLPSLGVGGRWRWCNLFSFWGVQVSSMFGNGAVNHHLETLGNNLLLFNGSVFLFGPHIKFLLIKAWYPVWLTNAVGSVLVSHALFRMYSAHIKGEALTTAAALELEKDDDE